MPWVRGHYARSSRTRRYGRSYGAGAGTVVAILVGVLLVLYLANR